VGDLEVVIENVDQRHGMVTYVHATGGGSAREDVLSFLSLFQRN
jgi:hypothetical protein